MNFKSRTLGGVIQKGIKYNHLKNQVWVDTRHYRNT